ncbi:ATP-binding protein [Georgenia subflava]|uniref:DUF4062 domain-containing protein n=1 Tax=Georgenia subflava TaxID=1622177 RepID=A0A6N7EET8_9MICO|nr:DUF4062 domain-containing protein [Georgenia subflava]MPV35881.1 DUF4062 domain-containing protein [Georgenia subflava]
MTEKPLIRTPDQRLRVFVSSTLQELAPERAAARASVERLRLTPVMFELGARPHPPRDLYRAYLDQSHVFVGLYWQRYGWVAPGEEVSGLEDEYHLSAGLPRLIYVKAGDGREERLGLLLDRIREDDTASYKEFGDAAELASLLEVDLAVLLSERFELASLPPGQTVGDPRPEVAAKLPPALATPLTPLVGRDDQVGAVGSLLASDDARLVTLVGPGGIGKTRLAREVAARSATVFPDGVWFVDLAAVADPALVPDAVARALGVHDTGDAPLSEKLQRALARRRTLLVLDNFEQVVEAANGVVALLGATPGLKVLVTSRALLRVGGEHGIEVGPLGLPAGRAPDAVAAAHASPAVELFLQRARSVRPDFQLDASNVGAVSEICRALDGVPLALELAAARLRTLPPSALLERLDRALPLLSGGARDLPARQRTLRGTLDWSYGLLGPNERRLFTDLGVFAGQFPLDAAEEVADRPGSSVLDGLGALVDSSLLRQQDRDGTPWFTMLAVVREYARERLEASPDLEEVRARHAAHHLRVAERAGRRLYGPEQRAVTARLTLVHDDLRAAVVHLLDHHDGAAVVQLVWDLFLYWWVDGHLDQARLWMEEALAGEQLPALERARALALGRLVAFMQSNDPSVVRDVEEAITTFRQHGDAGGESFALSTLALTSFSDPEADLDEAQARLERAVRRARDAGDRWREAMALFTAGRIALASGELAPARDFLLRARSVARRAGDEFTSIVALTNLAWVALDEGDLVAATPKFAEALASAESIGHDEGVAYGLEGLGAVAALSDEPDRAGLLLGAAASRRARSGLRSFNLPAALDDRARTSDPDVFDRAYETGLAMSDADALAAALERETGARPRPGP